MELGAATSSSTNSDCIPDSDDGLTQQRLAALLDLNAEKARVRLLYRTDRERFEAASMSRPLSSQKVFAYFGLMIGSMPPLALVLKALIETGPAALTESFIAVLLMVAGVTTGLVGYATGRSVPAIIERVAAVRIPNNVFALSAVGFAWGAISGGIGGLFLFVIGSIPAGILGGIVGAITLPILAALHSALRSGDVMELKHFLPIAFGMTLSVCAFILGL